MFSPLKYEVSYSNTNDFEQLISLAKSLPIYKCDQTHVTCYLIAQKFRFFRNLLRLDAQ